MAKDKTKVLLVVTIPTHMRIMMQMADMLARSSNYQPVLVYHPHNVFSDDVEKCQSSPHRAFMWTGDMFLEREEWLRGDWRQAAINRKAEYIKNTLKAARRLRLLTRIKLRAVLGDRFIEIIDKAFPVDTGRWIKLRQKLPFLPQHPPVAAIRRTVISFLQSSLYFVAYSFSTIKILSLSFGKYTEPTLKWMNLSKQFSNRNFISKALLTMYATKWASGSLTSSNEKNIFSYMAKLFDEGIFYGVGEQKIFYTAFNKLAESEKPGLIILPEANLFYQSHLISSIAKNHNIPCAVVPFTIVNTLEWAEAFWNVPMYRVSGLWNRLMAIAFPKWVLKHRGRKLILPPYIIITAEYLGSTPDIPWLINSGGADVIAAESQFMIKYYVRAGIKENKLALTGTLADDQLYTLLANRTSARAKIFSHYAIKTADRVILVGLPPDQFSAGIRKGCEFDSYNEMIRFMLSSLMDNIDGNTIVMISLHPRINQDSIKWIEDLGVYIVHEPVERLIPLADLYIAVVSATIRTAMACGIPVINYDSYNYNYDDYNNLPAMLEVNSKAAYLAAINSMLNDSQFYAARKTDQEKMARELYCIDGKAETRFIELFNRLTEKTTAAAA